MGFYKHVSIELHNLEGTTICDWVRIFLNSTNIYEKYATSELIIGHKEEVIAKCISCRSFENNAFTKSEVVNCKLVTVDLLFSELEKFRGEQIKDPIKTDDELEVRP